MEGANGPARRLAPNDCMVADASWRRPGTPRDGLHDMSPRLLAAALALICAVAFFNLRTAGSQGSSASSGFVAPVAMALPDFLRPGADSAFGTSLVRITKPGPLGNGVLCGPKYCSHRYSSAQAWNA